MYDGGFIMLILGWVKTTLLDYPEHIATTLFTGGCNFRCPYCHNRDLVLKSPSLVPLPEEEIFSFLKKRLNILTGVCITGGEPTLYPDLPEFAKRIKELGYLIKLDTNGSNPQMLHSLIHAGLIDYCAMDIKNSPHKYETTIGYDADCMKFDLTAIEESVQILMHQQLIPYEFRTTVVKEFHSEADMYAIAKWIAGSNAYFLQSYTDSAGVMCDGYHAHTENTLQKFAAICRQFVPNTTLRGIG